METTITETDKNTSVFIHLSTFLQYFFPFGNFIAPLLIWTTNREKVFVDYNGKQALNFQISILIYKIILGAMCIPFALYFAADFFSLIENIENTSRSMGFHHLAGIFLLIGIAGVIFLSMFIFELIVVINAAIHASKGLYYKYPLSIQFFKTQTKNTI